MITLIVHIVAVFFSVSFNYFGLFNNTAIILTVPSYSIIYYGKKKLLKIQRLNYSIKIMLKCQLILSAYLCYFKYINKAGFYRLRKYILFFDGILNTYIHTRTHNFV